MNIWYSAATRRLATSLAMHILMCNSEMYMYIAISWESLSKRQSMCIALGVYAYFGGFQGGHPLVLFMLSFGTVILISLTRMKSTAWCRSCGCN
jgi:hypothetical protein